MESDDPLCPYPAPNTATQGQDYPHGFTIYRAKAISVACFLPLTPIFQKMALRYLRRRAQHTEESKLSRLVAIQSLNRLSYTTQQERLKIFKESLQGLDKDSLCEVAATCSIMAQADEKEIELVRKTSGGRLSDDEAIFELLHHSTFVYQETSFTVLAESVAKMAISGPYAEQIMAIEKFAANTPYRPVDVKPEAYLCPYPMADWNKIVSLMAHGLIPDDSPFPGTISEHVSHAFISFYLSSFLLFNLVFLTAMYFFPLSILPFFSYVCDTL